MMKHRQAGHTKSLNASPALAEKFSGSHVTCGSNDVTSASTRSSSIPARDTRLQGIKKSSTTFLRRRIDTSIHRRVRCAHSASPNCFWLGAGGRLPGCQGVPDHLGRNDFRTQTKRHQQHWAVITKKKRTRAPQIKRLSSAPSPVRLRVLITCTNWQSGRRRQFDPC